MKRNTLVSRGIRLVLMVALVGIAACSQHPLSPEGPAVPGVGSYYIYAVHEMDLHNNLSQATVFDTLTVIGTGLTIDGIPDVIALTSSLGKATYFLRYETNGDLSLRTKAGSDSSTWTRYPFGSRDTMAISSKTPYGLESSEKLSYIGEESYMFNREELRVTKVEKESTESNGIYTDVWKTTYWYSPRIGFFIGTTSSGLEIGDGMNTAAFIGGGQSELVEAVRK